MLTPQITVNQWLSLRWDIRLELAKIFNLKKSGQSIVTSMGVQSDGHTPIDLQAITLEKLQEVTKSKSEDYFELINLLIENIKNNNQEKTHEKEIITKKSVSGRKSRSKVSQDSEEPEGE